jgi:hypothetical protein
VRCGCGVTTDEGTTPAVAPGPNPAPEALRHQTFIVREILALAFVGFWLFLFAVELFTTLFVLPFWYHAVSVGVLGYSLGINVAELTAYRPPSRRRLRRE